MRLVAFLVRFLGPKKKSVFSVSFFNSNHRLQNLDDQLVKKIQFKSKFKFKLIFKLKFKFKDSYYIDNFRSNVS